MVECHAMIIAHSPPVDAPGITHFQVFGERRSGTNYLRVLLEQNFDITPVFHYGWKHGFMTAPAVSSRALIVGIVRNPVDWLISMNATPFATVERLKDLPFGTFIRAPWEGVARPAGQGWRVAGYRQDLSLRGEVLQLDRHPIEGRPFRNVLELRRTKLQGLLGLTQRVTHAAILRHEDARDDPAGVIAALAARFELAAANTLSLPDGYVGNKSNPKRINRWDICAEDRAWISTELDLDLEHRCGYVPSFEK